METITLKTDLVTVLSTDRRQTAHDVTFEGVKLGEWQQLGRNPLKTATLTTTRGEYQTLYQTNQGVYLVFVLTWSDWQGDAPATATLYRLTDDTHLQPGGRFEGLGAACGLARPMTWQTRDDAGKTKSMAALEMCNTFEEEYKRTGNAGALGDASIWYTRYLDALLDEAGKRGKQ